MQEIRLHTLAPKPVSIEPVCGTAVVRFTPREPPRIEDAAESHPQAACHAARVLVLPLVLPAQLKASLPFATRFA